MPIYRVGLKGPIRNSYWDQNHICTTSLTNHKNITYMEQLHYHASSHEPSLPDTAEKGVCHGLRFRIASAWPTPTYSRCSPSVTQTGSALEGPEVHQHGRTALVSRLQLEGLYSIKEFWHQEAEWPKFQIPNHFISLLSPWPGYTRILGVPGRLQTHQALKDLGKVFPWSC